MRKHEPLLRSSLVGMDTRWVRKTDVIRVSFDFDIDMYLRGAGDR